MSKYLDILSTGQYLKRLYEHLFFPLLEEYQLTQVQADVLLFLANNPKYDTAKEIVERRGLTKSHVSAAVDGLIEREYLKRESDHLDRRCIHLVLLEQASEIIEKGRKIQQEYLKQLHQGFTEEEYKMLDLLLDRIRENVNFALKQQK